MRLLLYTAAYPSPAAPDRAVFVETQARELVRRHRVRVLAPRVHAGDPRRERRSGVAVRRFAYASGGRLLRDRPRPGPVVLGSWAMSSAGALAAEVASFRPDVIYAHWALPCGPFAVAAAAVARRPLVLAVHGSDLEVQARRSARWAALAALGLRRAEAVLADSEDLAAQAVALGAGEARVEVLRGVPGEGFAPGSRIEARAALGLAPEARLALFVGDLSADKGADRLAAAAPSWRSWQVAALGGGPWDDALRRAGVRVLGVRPNEEVAVWMRAADLLVHPSRHEGTPVAILEALVTGLPVAASRVGGVPEVVVEGVGGWLFPGEGPVPPPPGDRDLARAREALLLDAARQRAGGRARLARLEAVLERAAATGPEVVRRRARTLERARAALAATARRRGRVLDAGAGSGAAARHLSDSGFEVEAVDLCPSSPTEYPVRRWDLSLGPPAAPCGPGGTFPPGVGYDLVLCLDVLEHMDDPTGVLTSLAAALREGGELVLSLPNERSLAPPGRARHRHRFGPGAAVRLARAAGLTVVSRSRLSVVPPRWGEPARALGRCLAALWPGAFAIGELVCARRIDGLPPGPEALGPGWSASPPARRLAP